MKSSPSVSSSDLERGRAIAERLVSANPGAAVAPVEKPAEYVSFKARGVATAAPPSRPAPPAVPMPAPRPAPAMGPAPAPPAPVAPPRPELPPFAAEPTRVEPPAVRSEPPARATAPPLPPPVAPPRASRPAAVPPPPPPLAAPVNESVFEMDDGAGFPEGDEGLGVLEDEPLEPLEPLAPESPAPEAAVAEPSLEFEEDIADVAAAAVGAVEEPVAAAERAPTWADILDDAIYLAHARCALVMDGAGQVHESRGDWPKNTLDKVAARLLRGIEQAPAPVSPDATQLIEIQLGSFFLTGLRAVLQDSPVVVGFLSQAPVKREARPGLEAEIKRGTALS